MKNTTTEMVVLSTSEEAARQVSVTGWVSRGGRFYGADERGARWDGATHVPCADCGQPVAKSRTRCRSCQEKVDLARFLARERRPYEGGMLYSDALERFFDSDDDVLDYAADEGISDLDDLRLRLCEPVYPRWLDDDYWTDELPEDCSLDDVAGDLAEAVAKVNAVIKEMRADRKPMSWQPGKYALDAASIRADGPLSPAVEPDTRPSGEDG